MSPRPLTAAVSVVVASMLTLAPANHTNHTIHTIHVSPTGGRDEAGRGGASSPLRTLAAARQHVRAALLRGDGSRITVQLHPGRHVVSGGPLVLGPQDSGSPGAPVVWQSHSRSSPAVVDGGTQVTGWANADGHPGLLSAPLPAGLKSTDTVRQMWVNGQRASRPVVFPVDLDKCCGSPCRNREAPFYPCSSCNCTVTNTTNGYDFSQSTTDPSSWANPGDIEFVFHFPGEWTPWIEPRCTVASIAGKQVTLKQPCFSDIAQRNLGPSKAQMRPLPPPAYIENVFANLTAPGQWYFDRVNAKFFYKPRPGETIAAVEQSSYTTTEETILLVNGTSNLAWEGVLFEHATWLLPNTERGFVDWQGGYSGGYGTAPDYNDCSSPQVCKAYADANGCGSTTKPAPHCAANRGVEPPGNVRVEGATNVTFTGCRFQHLGGIYAISANRGSQHVSILNCTFADVSGGAIHIGSTGSRWTTGPLAPQQENVNGKGNTARVDENTASAPPHSGRAMLVARKCNASSPAQQWIFSPGVKPGISKSTIVRAASAGPNDTTDCWRVLACLSDEGAKVGVGYGCTPLPKSRGCGGHNCACNGAFAFNSNGTITSQMDGHCLTIDSESDGSAATMQTCTGQPTQKFLTQPVGTDAYLFTQDEGVMCVDASITPRRPPRPPPPPSPPSPPGPPHPHPPPPPPSPTPPPVPEADWDSWFNVRNNHIYDMPVEFRGAVGIFGGYIRNSTIAHNTLKHLTYTGISVGWGWGQLTFAGGNAIVNNSIDGVLPYLADGGCIYTQSNMRGSAIAGNWLQHDGNRYGVIYTDGATDLGVHNNVINGGNAPCVFFLHGGHGFTVSNIWYNASQNASLCCGAVPKSAPWPAHELQPGQAWPPEAQAIIDNAGRHEEL